MEKFRKIWTKELNEWLLTTKGMKSGDAYALFLATFPEITDVTRCAFCNQRSRVGAAGECHNPKFSRAPRPLWSEQVKRGYVRIKIAQPNVWVSKAKWVYMETHPWEDFTERSNYVFLDGDNRNFDPANIERVPLSVMGQFNLMGGCEKGNPDVTHLRILLAKTKIARFDLGEKLGLVTHCGTAERRVFIEERNRRQRERGRLVTLDEEKRERRNATARAYLAKKRLDPEWVEKYREYRRNWARKKRAEAKK